jgi:Lon-like ATP-dependent protease
MGDDSGILLPIVATVTPSQGDGRIIATGKLQEIAQEAVQNVSALIKKISGESLEDKDVHIQFVQTYEGVDGDSASVTVATAVLSALTGIPVNQDVAMTGSLSVRGEVLPVGGVTHKIEAAAKSGMDRVIIPKANEADVMIEDKFKDEIEIETAEHLGDVLEISLETSTDELDSFIKSLKNEQKSGLLSLSDLNPSSQLSVDES